MLNHFVALRAIMPASPSPMRETVTLSRRVAVSHTSPTPGVSRARTSAVRTRLLAAGLVAAALSWPAAAREVTIAPHDAAGSSHRHEPFIEIGVAPRFGFAGVVADGDALYEPGELSPELEASLTSRKYKRDPKSGNFLAPRSLPGR